MKFETTERKESFGEERRGTNEYVLQVYSQYIFVVVIPQNSI